VNLLDYLFDLERHGIKLGLDNIHALLLKAGNPHEQYPAVHITGTNGKGSVAAMLDAILRAAGCVSGRFTSPHLIDIAERFAVRGELIKLKDLENQIAFFQNAAAALQISPTFFEVNTAIAFRWFAEKHIDIAIVEVGMGGRFDSTNVITPLVSAITTIDLEHTRHLGDTLEKIAFEKAGIIKPNVPVVLGKIAPEPLSVITACATDRNAPIYRLGRDFEGRSEGGPFDGKFYYESPALRLGPLSIGLAGTYQADNAAMAVTIALRLRDRFPGINHETLAAGLQSARWPCRLERVLDTPPVIVDVAHNPAGAHRLAKELGPCVLVLAVSSDKDVARMLEALAPIARHLILTRFEGNRSLSVDNLCAAAGSREFQRADSLNEAIDAGMSLATKETPLLITGSIFTAGEARRILHDKYGADPLRF